VLTASSTSVEQRPFTPVAAAASRDGAVGAQERGALRLELQRLDPAHLGRVSLIVHGEMRSPEDVDVDVDALSPYTFQRLMRFVRDVNDDAAPPPAVAAAGEAHGTKRRRVEDEGPADGGEGEEEDGAARMLRVLVDDMGCDEEAAREALVLHANPDGSVDKAGFQRALASLL